jgi:signal transduction histidine kinase
VGAIGLTQFSNTISPDEYQVHSVIANQLSVALNNIGNHQRNRAAVESLKVTKRNLETYIELATDAQEEERKRLSRELHDDILQSLVVAKSRIEPESVLERPDKSRDRLQGAQELLGEAIVNVRRYCHDLRPSLLDDLGLVDAVDWLVGDLRTRTALDATLTAVGVTHRLDNKDELLIFRIVQEALHNVERHSHASQAWVQLAYNGAALSVTVSDNGRGLAQGDAELTGGSPSPGLGLRGMDERTKLLRGTLAIQGRPGGGTELRLRVPLSPGDSLSGPAPVGRSAE